MKTFVFWTATISVISGAGLQFTAVASKVLPNAPPGMLLHVFGLMAMFLGIMLILCSRDLPRRGSLVAWEGVLRIGGFGVMAGYAIFGGEGLQAAAAGLFDLVVGLVYLVGLPRHLGVSLVTLLFDRPVRGGPEGSLRLG